MVECELSNRRSRFMKLDFKRLLLNVRQLTFSTFTYVKQVATYSNKNFDLPASD
jgi:hypothetical protein